MPIPRADRATRRWQAPGHRRVSAAAPLLPGGQSTGKVYFDAVGEAPTSVVYNGPGDMLTWIEPPAAPAEEEPAAEEEAPAEEAPAEEAPAEEAPAESADSGAADTEANGDVAAEEEEG